jgi:hypothetical protein
MPNYGLPPKGGFAAKVFSGVLEGMTQRYQQGQAQQREDELARQQAARQQAATEQQFEMRRDLQTQSEKAASERQKKEHEFRLLETLLSHASKKELSRLSRGAGGGAGADYLSTLGKSVMEAKRAFPAYDDSTQQKIGEIMYGNQTDALSAGAALMKARSEGREIGGLPPGPKSPVKLEGRRSDLKKDLVDTGIIQDFEQAARNFPSVFPSGDQATTEDQDKFIMNVVDKMMAIEELQASGIITPAEGVTARLQAEQNVISSGLAGTPGKNYEDSPILNFLSPETKQKIMDNGPASDIGLDPQIVNDAISEALGRPYVIFSGGETPTYEDIILKMVAQGFNEASIMDAVRGVFEPEQIMPEQSGNIGLGFAGAGQQMLNILKSVR